MSRDEADILYYIEIALFIGITLATNPVINHECENDRDVITTNGTYP
jgi:hypothetical protein